MNQSLFPILFVPLQKFFIQMKRIIPFLILGAALLFAACHHHDDDEVTTFERTVLVYIAGDNNLSDYIRPDVDQMIEGSNAISKESNRLLLFVDQKGKKPFFMEVCQGDTTTVKTFDEELNTGTEATLQTAMRWVMDNYPSKSYGLVLWGHADGWIIKGSRASDPTRAYGVDVTGGSKWIDIPQMAASLEALPRLKFIFADCCAFQCVESAYELRNCTDYIIASPAEIPGEGAPYQTVVPAMFSKADDFYKAIVDAYYAQVSYGYQEPLSVVNTSAMENLAQATRTTLATFVPKLENSRYPDVEGLIYYYDHTQFDMQDFMLRYADSNQYAEWKKAFDQAVVYKTMTTVWMANHVRYTNTNYDVFKDFTVTADRYGGLGMYVPQLASNIVAFEYQPYLLTFSIDGLNTTIQKMQWYTAAGLNAVGW